MIFKILKPFGELRRGESAYTDTAKQPVRSLCCDLNLIKRCFQRDKKASEVNAAFKGHGARSWQQCQIKALSQKFNLSSSKQLSRVSCTHSTARRALKERSAEGDYRKQVSAGRLRQHSLHTACAAALTGPSNTQPRPAERCSTSSREPLQQGWLLSLGGLCLLLSRTRLKFIPATKRAVTVQQLLSHRQENPSLLLLLICATLHLFCVFHKA